MLIEQMTASHQYLLNQIDDLNYIQQAKKNLDVPFIESVPEKQIGVIELQTEDILDFFDTIRDYANRIRGIYRATMVLSWIPQIFSSVIH